MEVAKDLFVTIEADSVLSPQLYYGDPFVAVYFTTADDKHGRITFENLDSIRISRGEHFPYKYDWKADSEYCWIKVVQNSSWLRERYNYEHKYYGTAYQFNGDVNEMLTDFKHYVFSFHDEFIEAIARGFWLEESSTKLPGKVLTKGHPFLPISENNVVKIEAHGLTCQARINNLSEEVLKLNSVFCSQKLIEFALELENTSVSNTLSLIHRNNKYISTLRGYFGNNEIEFDKFARLEDVKPYIETYMKEVAERRKSMGK